MQPSPPQFAWLDVDGDGTTDVIGTFASTKGPGALWVDAVSGKTGESLWRYAADPSWIKSPKWSEPVWIPASVIRVGKESKVVLVAATTVTTVTRYVALRSWVFARRRPLPGTVRATVR